MMKVRWSEEASRRIDEIIVEAFARSGRERATKVFADMIAHIALLEDHPQMGRMVPEHERADVREVVSRGYRIVYLVHLDDLEVVTVLRPREPLPRLVLPPVDG